MAGRAHLAAPGREDAVIAVTDALAHVAAVLGGGACIAVFLRSAVIAVFLQRPRHDSVARISAAISGAVFDMVLPRSAPQARVDRVLVWFWPVTQFVMIYAWYTLVIAGFAAVYWGTGASPDAVQALIASGSSLSTLGFATPSNLRGEVIAIMEGEAELIEEIVQGPALERAVRVLVHDQRGDRPAKGRRRRVPEVRLVDPCTMGR